MDHTWGEHKRSLNLLKQILAPLILCWCSRCFWQSQSQFVHTIKGKGSIKKGNLPIHQLSSFDHFVCLTGNRQEPQRKQNLVAETGSCGTREFKVSVLIKHNIIAIVLFNVYFLFSFITSPLNYTRTCSVDTTVGIAVSII